MYMFKRVLIIFISVLLGAMFIASAWLKLYPIELFEYQITGSTFFGWDTSVFVARIIIAIEFALGILLIAAYDLKRTIPAMIVLLVVFCIHLVYLWASRGNQVDCGCMGEGISITPLQGILKNLGMIALGFVVYRWGHAYRFNIKQLNAYLLIVCATVVFILNPVDLNYARTYLNKPFEQFNLDLNSIYNSQDKLRVEHPSEDVRNRQLVLSFLSASCPHCKIAATKISVIKRRNPEIPFYFFINGEDKDIETFLLKTETSGIPHSRLNGPEFIQAAGLNLPVIYYYDKGAVVKQVDYYTLDQKHIEQWLKLK